jgi:glycosyltransferase involved in cell wall biosynthesis
VVLLSKFIYPKKFYTIVSIHSFVTVYLGRELFASLKQTLVFILYRRAYRVIAVSNGIVPDLKENYRIPLQKIRVVYNGIAIDKIDALASIQPDALFFDGITPVVLSCGRLAEMKNFPLLINAFAMLLKKIPARLVIMGAGKQRQSLEKLVSELGIASHVFFTGYMENPFQYMKKSDIFVLSSLYEPFGLVLVEAMVCGTPVISTDCPSGPGEIIEHGVNGLLVPPNDPQALADAMKKVLTSPLLRRKLSSGGRKRALDFSVEKMTAEYERIFDETCPT